MENISVGKLVLPNKPLSNIELIDAAKKLKIPNFRGVFLRDILPNKPRKNECGILNLDSSDGSGTHWVAWFKKNNKDYFHGFFQENEGSIILVVDSVTPVVSNRDNPTPTTLYSGSIWTMQFRTTFQGKNSCNNRDQKYIFQYNKETPGSNIPPLADRNKKCWFFTRGPFDCRTWRDGDGVDTFRAVNPDGSCYQKMGTFIGLDILKAFGVNKRSDIAVHN